MVYLTSDSFDDSDIVMTDIQKENKTWKPQAEEQLK